MAKPRIFVSSTYYDLKYIRADLDRFIRELGYESVLNEKGNIPYGSSEKLEEYCYKEIELCDILVSVIGGRFGSESQNEGYSVSNVELKTAIDKGRQVYIFIENAVLSEYRTYEANKDNKDIVYASVDDVRIYKFIEEVFSLPLNNQVKGFDTVQEINKYLEDQWAGLFQRLLHESARQKEINIIEDLKATSKTLDQLVGYLVAEKTKGDQTVKEILLINHPLFEAMKRDLEIPYRVFFQNFEELSALMRARQYEEEDIFGKGYKDGFYTWKKKGAEIFFRVSNELFEDGNLRVVSSNEWKKDWVEYDDDDIPF